MTRETTYELTPLQQSMFASAALTGKPWHFVEQIVVDIPDERLDPDVLAQAWTDLTRRHPALRMVIQSTGPDRPMQSVAPPQPVEPAVEDWSALDAAEIEERLAKFLASDRLAGVDATRALAFRLSLFVTGANRSKLVWTFPHSLLDGRSFAPLLNEVFDRYEALRAGGSVDPVEDGGNLFADHCTRLAELDHAAGLSHFAQSLDGWKGATGLIDRDAAPARKSFDTHVLDASQTAALSALARDCDVPVGTVITAAWGLVLARAAGQDEVVFGTTRNGRHLVDGSAQAAGCFITTVPMRVDLSPNGTVADLLHKLRQDQIAARPYEHTPLTLIRRTLDIPPDRQLFDSVLMFDFGTLDTQVKAFGGKWTDRHVDLLEEGDTPITLAAYFGETLQIELEYDTAQVPNALQLGTYLHQVLTALGHASPDTPTGAISMLDQTAEHRLHSLAGPALPPPSDTCLDRIVAQAGSQANKTALMQPGQAEISYQALDDSARILAGRLIAAGVQPGDVVGLCMARGSDFITAMVAVWQAGAAFVPMDPGYPPETLDIIAEDSRARLVLTDDTAPQLAAITHRIDDLAQPSPAPLPGARPEDTAYVIFTSGSTGRPKGVMVSHRSLAAHADAATDLYGLTSSDRALQFAALSFDVALEEIVPTLACGATLVLRSDDMARSIATFLDETQSHELTVLNLPTGFWVALTDVLEQQSLGLPPCVRLVIVGGERVPLSVLRRWRNLVPGIRWINGYGPTETTITCTAHEVVSLGPDEISVPIGRPLSHARAWVLTRDGALAPEGIEGELFISGTAVSQGYIHNPDRTEQSFKPALFGGADGRLYATGDRVVWRDGVLDYLGRVDRQIKLRGFRIEPGQIEAALEAQPAIDRAYAAVHTADDSAPMLVAWYSVTPGAQEPSEADIAAWLADTLPPQMRPVTQRVETWPITPGGKVDTAALPAPSATPQKTDHDTTDDTPLTREVANLFQQVLNTNDIQAGTSFFDAGGDSLSLLRLMPEIEAAFGVALKPTAIYSDPTPRGVVRALQEQDPDPLVVVQIQPKGTLPPIYGVHVLGDDGSFFRPLAAELGSDQPVFGLTVGLLSDSTPTSVPDIARFYLHQIERHYPQGPLTLIAVSAGSYVTLELAHQLLNAGREIEAFILLDAEGPGGRPTKGRMARVAVHAGQVLREGWPYLARHLSALREKRVEDEALRKLQAVRNENDTVAGENIASIADFVAANLMAIEAYQPRPLPKRITIYRAGFNRFDSADALKSGLGWQDVATEGFDLVDVPGDHLGILQLPHVKSLAGQVRDLLARYRNTHG